uniref:Uncharacterized protein n=1 Tax=Aureoumbra lagunensis TaxID=44058 RepID=A0A7S3K6J7_9STRA|mmetsp:Transcript_20660/g.26750  ORF Transcript_20660/g.26750 Transcript_20660/m.26750 type:complete len:313 (+) Transcript_20660:44-982(+)
MKEVDEKYAAREIDARLSEDKMKSKKYEGFQQLFMHWGEGTRIIIKWLTDFKTYAAIAASCRHMQFAAEYEAEALFELLGMQKFPVLVVQAHFIKEFRLACRRLTNLESSIQKVAPRLVKRKWTDYCGHVKNQITYTQSLDNEFAFGIDFRLGTNSLATIPAVATTHYLAGNGSPHALALLGTQTLKNNSELLSALSGKHNPTVNLHILRKSNGAQALIKFGLFVCHENKLKTDGFLSAGFGTELSIPEQILGADLPRNGFLLVSQANMNLVVENHSSLSFHIHFDIGLGPHWNSLSPQGVTFMLGNDCLFV